MFPAHDLNPIAQDEMMRRRLEHHITFVDRAAADPRPGWLTRLVHRLASLARHKQPRHEG